MLKGAGRSVSQGARPLAAACLVILGVLLLAACARYQVDDVIIIQYPFREPRYPLTPLTHREHSLVYRDQGGNRIRCVDCHHTWDARSAAPPPLCTECHGEFGDIFDVPALMHAYHILCTECHRATEEAGRPHGPTYDCASCHNHVPDLPDG